MFSKPKYKMKTLMASLVLNFCSGQVQAFEKYDFGKKASAKEIAAYNIDIHANGKGLPLGSGNVELGAKIFKNKCSVCHGEKLNGVRAMGTQSMLKGRRAINKLPHATSLFDYIRRAMPMPAPGTLSNDETYALVAFLLTETGVLKNKNTTLNAKKLIEIIMPNRDNYLVDPTSRFTAKELKSDTQ